MNKLQIKLFKLMLISVLLCHSGCGTVINLTKSGSPRSPRSAPMGGVAVDLGGMSLRPELIIILGPDLPLSFAADIVTLPYTVPYTLLNDPKKHQDKSEDKTAKQKIEHLQKEIPLADWNQVYKISADENISEGGLRDKVRRITIGIAKQFDLKLVDITVERIIFKKGNEIGVYVIWGLDKNPSYLILTNYRSGELNKTHVKLIHRLENEFKNEFGDRFHKLEDLEEILSENKPSDNDTQSK